MSEPAEGDKKDVVDAVAAALHKDLENSPEVFYLDTPGQFERRLVTGYEPVVGGLRSNQFDLHLEGCMGHDEGGNPLCQYADVVTVTVTYKHRNLL